MIDHLMLIGGERRAATGGGWIEFENPFTGRAWARVPRGQPEDVQRAVASARAAFQDKPWRGLTASARGALLYRLADLIAARADELARIETTDNGKLIVEMTVQLRYLPQWFRYFGGLADKIEGRVLPIDKPGMLNFTRQEPLGVVAAITPWNSPLLLAAWKLAPALAAGNTVVWKPSEFSSVSALVFGELFEAAGIPPGVVNIVTGYGNEIGEALVGHPEVAKIAFTGGDATGQRVYELAARGIKPVTLELGGKSANIVFDDADLDNAVKGVVSGIFAATGQTCIAGSRATGAALDSRSIRRKSGRVRSDGAHGRPLGSGDPGRSRDDARPTREGARLYPDRVGRGCALPSGRRCGRTSRGRSRLVRGADDFCRRPIGHANRTGGGVRARCLRSSPSTTRTTQWRSPMAHSTAWLRGSGPEASGEL